MSVPAEQLEFPAASELHEATANARRLRAGSEPCQTHSPAPRTDRLPDNTQVTAANSTIALKLRNCEAIAPKQLVQQD